MSHKRLFIDTDVLVYAMEQAPKPETESLVQRARQLVDDAVKEKEEILVSTITVAEYLGGIDPNLREAYADIIYGRFRLVPLGYTASRHAARVQFEAMRNGQVPDGYERSRVVLKADILILGCVMAESPNRFVTNDDRFLKMAARYFPDSVGLPEARNVQGEFGF